MRVYNLTKKASEDFLRIAWSQRGPLQESAPDDTVPKAKDVKIAELDDPSLAIIFDKDLGVFFGRRGENIYFPLLKDQLVLPSLSSATVDMGAVKFVCNGANIMRPGIVSFAGDFQKGELLVVKEVSHQKAIAVGKAFDKSESLKVASKGQTIENLHYVGDKFWEALKLLETG